MRPRLDSRALLVAGLLVLISLLVSGAAGATGGATGYVAATPVVDGVLNAPWNTSQGDPAAGPPPAAPDLFPTYLPSGAGPANLALYPAASGATPYPSGVAGTPGPLAGYCIPGYPSDEGAAVQNEPAGIDLPMAPYYFPDVVRNADGSLTGYFDYRPKDADEAIVVAKSTDNGRTWSAEGSALDQNGGYCPTGDANDDGQGHPFVMGVGGQTLLYTLQRPAGDNTGIGLLVHAVSPAAADPLGAVPASEPVGIDPNTFATAAASVPTSGGVSIPVSTLGTAGSPEQIVAGPYEDLSAASPSSSIVTCTGTGSGMLTGCTAAGTTPLAVGVDDDLVQVIATANPGAGKTYTIPQGPNAPDGSGGLATVSIANATAVSPLTTYILNLNAPNRVYIDGATVYCAQSNANPTTKIENCTTTRPGGLTVSQGDAITADPILPATATLTSGLIAPDGIVGTLPTYPGAPSGSTIVLYTEKILSYFIEGTTNAKVTLPAATINFTPSVTQSEQPLPASGTFSIYLGTAVGSPIQQLTCTGVSAGSAGSENLTGCSGGTGTVASGNWIGGPNSATVPFSVLNQIGEGNNGSSKGPEKLFGNNEDLTVLRAAYTTDGINFTDLGPISGTTSGTGSTNGSYDDVSNPDQTASPSTTLPADLAPGSPDTVELRFVGSRGTIVTNPDGSYGMFLSGAWASDGDSDAFNQIFYTSSTDGQHWSTPTVVLSTDYTFAASAAQDQALAGGVDAPLGISAYFSGRAYGPSVVQNPDGTLTMVFSGYRIPKPIVSAGTVLGTNPAALYTVGATDPALYRNILTVTLSSATAPGVPTATAVTSSAPSTGYGSTVTYTATVTVPPPGSGIPTGTVAFAAGGAAIAGCSAVPLSDAVPDVATCTASPGTVGTHQVAATYSADSNYAASTGTASQTVTPATLTVTAKSQSRLFGLANPALTATIAGFVNGDTGAAVSGSPACSTTATAASPGGSYPITCGIGTLAASNYVFSFAPGTLTVGYTRTITGVVRGPLEVRAGDAIDLAAGAIVRGPVAVGAGGSLDVEGGSVDGPLEADRANVLRICAAHLDGPLDVENDTGPVVAGDGTPACRGNTILGPVTLERNTGGVTLVGNDIWGPVAVTTNRGGVTVTHNTIRGPLTVRDNTGPVVDTPNVVIQRRRGRR